MSAHYPGQACINALVTYATAHGLFCVGAFSPAAAINVLVSEVNCSLKYRYPLDADAGEVFPYQADQGFMARSDVDRYVYGLCRYYAYQACEHPGWPESSAQQLIDTIQTFAVGQVIDIEPYWGYECSQTAP